MFYCDPCAKEHGYPETIMRSYGQCEICDESAVCNSRASALLPLSRKAKDRQQDKVRLEPVRAHDRIDKFLELFTDEEKNSWKGKNSKAPDWVVAGVTWFMGQDPGHQELMRRLADS